MAEHTRGDPTLTIATVNAPSESGWLVLFAGTEAEQRIALGKTRVCIGKDTDVQICLPDPHVSAQHAEIVHTANGFVISDLQSLNGTHVDGVLVQSAVLQPGAMITVGTTRIRFETREPAEVTLPRPARDSGQFGKAIGETPAMRQLFGVLHRIAPTNLSVCVLGETGTGKEVIARAIHDASPRRERPLIVLDCGAVASTLIESQIFGHIRGSFTGAVVDRAGAFEEADGGTVFLDEIGELALDLQPKLLRVLETGVVTRVGTTREHKVDVRVIAATNRDLESEVRAGRFREDLWFRLSTAVVTLPPLRERRQDLPALVEAFVSAARPGLGVSADAMAILQNHDWPGNVRELKNVIEGAAAVCESAELLPRDFVLFHRRQRQPTIDRLPLAGKSLDDIERSAIRQSLAHFDGNKTKAAEALGIAPSTLYAKIKKYDL